MDGLGLAIEPALERGSEVFVVLVNDTIKLFDSKDSGRSKPKRNDVLARLWARYYS